MIMLSRFLLLLLLASCGKKMDKKPREVNSTVQFEREVREEVDDQLMNALAIGEPLLAEEAIRLGADINQINSDGLRPLALAIQNESIELVSLLIKNGADAFDVDENGNNVAHMAILFRKEKALYYFLKGGRLAFSVSENKEGLTPLEFAINENYVDGVKILLAYNNFKKVQELDYHRLFLLQKFHNNPEIAKLLELNQKLEKKEHLTEVFEKCLAEEFISGVELLASVKKLPSLSQGKNIIANVVTRAGKNFSDHHKTLISKLIRFGLNIEGEKEDTTTPLIRAIQDSNFEAVSYILSLGAKTETVSSEGLTALYSAVQLLKIKETELLMSLGAPTEYYYTEENKVYKVKICKTIPETRRSFFRRGDNTFSSQIEKLKEILQCN